MTRVQSEYVEAYRNVIAAVCNVEAYVSTSLRNQVDSLEAGMSADEIERLRDVARGFQ